MPNGSVVVIFAEQAKQMSDLKIRKVLEERRQALVDTGLTDEQRAIHVDIMVIAWELVERADR